MSPDDLANGIAVGLSRITMPHTPTFGLSYCFITKQEAWEARETMAPVSVPQCRIARPCPKGHRSRLVLNTDL